MCKSTARPEGFDYSKPDPLEDRCPSCNRDGFNRTGLMVVGYPSSGATSYVYGAPCSNNCKKGLYGDYMERRYADKSPPA